MGFLPSVRSRWLDIGQVRFLHVYGPRRINTRRRTRISVISWFSGIFSCGTRRLVPSGQDSSILPIRVANHSAGFDSSCPLTELAIQQQRVFQISLAQISHGYERSSGIWATNGTKVQCLLIICVSKSTSTQPTWRLFD